MSEDWKVIDEFPNYSISKDGVVKNNKTNKILLQRINNRYKTINLRKDGKTIHTSIHRLLGYAFIPNPDNKPLIDHINRNTLDNCVENLRWVTHKENQENRGEHCNNKLGEKYICFNKKYKKKPYWVSRKINGKNERAFFETLEEAKIFRDGLEDLYS